MIVYLKNQSNYKMKDFEGMSYDEIRPIFEKVWDLNHNFVPMDLEIEKEKKKPAEFQEIKEEQIEKDTSKKTTGKRKKYLPRRRTRSTAKKQKVEQDDEKEELKNYLDIVPREDVAVDVESLSTKYPIVDWKTYTLSENFMYYKIIRGDGSSKNYKILSEMLYDFDRQDVVELYRLVKERYSSSKPEGYDLMLWGDLHTLFEPDEESEIWMNQNEYNLIKKKYPLSQEMISKMLSKRLEVDQESTQAYELLKFIKSQERIVGNKSSSRVNTAKFLRELLEKKKFCNVRSYNEILDMKDHESSQNEIRVVIEDISNLRVGTEEQLEVESSKNKSSELESSITCNDNKKDSSSSSLKNVVVELDTIYYNSAEGHISVSSRSLSSCESVTTLGCDNSNDSTRIASSS
ncbi:hypothetical protein Tco_0709991 [Tanacetum coccineum]